MKLTEAFRALNALNEDTFSVADDGISKLAEFEQNDDLVDDISVIDPEAETEEDLQDSYVGKIILDCTVCHSKLYKDIEEVEVDDDDGTVANVGEECPYCYTSDGFKVLGQVSAFGGKTEESEEDTDDAAKDTNDDADTEDKSDDDDSVDENLSEGIFGLGKKKKPDFYSKEEIAKRKAQREAEWKQRDEDRKEQERQRGAEIARDWARNDKNKKDAQKEAERERLSKIKGSNVSNTGRAGVHYSGGDYYSESLEENLVESPVATLERPMSSIGGTLSNVMADHSDELANVYDRTSAIAFLDTIESEVKNKGYLNTIKEKISRLPDSRACQFLYNIILKGDGMGAKIESLTEDVNNVNVETDDSIVNVNTDNNGKVTVTTEPKTTENTANDGAEVITPLTDENEAAILGNTADDMLDEPIDEYSDVELDEFDDETFDGLGESYLKKVYENVQAYKTTDCSMKDDKIMLEGVITFNSGAKKKTSFIFEAKDFTKSGKYRFIGENAQLTRGKKAFTLKGRIDGGKFITESFNYNYKAKDTQGNSTRIYGTIKG